MDWSVIGLEIARGGTKTALTLTLILLPLMTFLELIRDARLLEKLAAWVRPVMQWFHLPKEGAFPLLAGIFFGISFGSGVILQFSKDKHLTRRDLTLIGIFLAICHGMIEDPLIFAAIGASWWIIVVIRISLATVTLLIISRLLKRTITED